MSIFGWIQSMSGTDNPLGDIVNKFGRMIVGCRHSFDLATDAYLLGADAKSIHADVNQTDEKINALHREIRRALIIHASLRGSGEVPFSMVMMSVAKDAELIGDYAKHIAVLALRRPKESGGAFHEHLLGLKSKVSTALGETRQLYESEDEEEAAAFVTRIEALKDECDAKTNEILTADQPRTVDPADPAATVLCYRYYRRILSHSLNIVTSVVLPVDFLDFYDEDKDTRGPAPTLKGKKGKKGKKDKGKDKGKGKHKKSRKGHGK